MLWCLMIIHQHGGTYDAVFSKYETAAVAVAVAVEVEVAAAAAIAAAADAAAVVAVTVVSFISNRIQQWDNTRKKTHCRYQ